MGETLSFILALSCGIPAVIGVFKWKNISKRYHSFIILMIVSVLSELIVGIAKLEFNFSQITPPVYNLYFAAEYFLYLVLYKDFQLFSFKTFMALVITGMLLLALDFIFLESGNSIKVLWQTIPLYAEIVLSLIIFFPSIKLLSLQVFQKTPFITNPKNFIAIGTILIKAYTILDFSFMLIKLPMFLSLLSYNIFQFINPFCYLIFTWAILCIPRKQKY
ncbi:MAG: hypothetical protein ABI405_04510 [Parafilimonas sp.]